VIIVRRYFMKKILVSLLVVGFMIGFLSVPKTHANLINNAGFETGDLTGWISTGVVGVYGTVSRPAPPYGPPYYFTVSPYEGNYMAELRGDYDAALKQTFNLASAGPVNISFKYNLFAYDFPSVEDGPDYFLVLDGGTLLNVSINDPVGLPVTTTNWQPFVWSGNLSAGPHTLQFYLETHTPGAPNQAAWAYVDAVSVAVPEPGILILLGISMASVVGLRRWWKD